ncbi:antibiotic biosynthesis monooxygenase family protein [Fulvivirga ligni]|uniref:antibiotic biosynthesis monooxygenase family protein n=1 Tax=Fulvivirga ligni TaxID=2904246 RepID=UPI001F21A4E8|nr:antibiotic biosynthesis monooxygenase [Fulvivirga ligni]UII23178.1 hypothetical protein LVD16_08055 [Fulvivirga ligni]
MTVKLTMLLVILVGGVAYAQTAKNQNDMNKNEITVFVDRFYVPKEAIVEFKERTKINRKFIEALDGFIEHAAYESYNDDGNLTLITIAKWESMEAIQKAKQKVQQKYKEEGFDLARMLKRLNITMERGLFKEEEL